VEVEFCFRGLVRIFKWKCNST